jgi:hypothetical protein
MLMEEASFSSSTYDQFVGSVRKNGSSRSSPIVVRLDQRETTQSTRPVIQEFKPFQAPFMELPTILLPPEVATRHSNVTSNIKQESKPPTPLTADLKTQTTKNESWLSLAKVVQLFDCNINFNKAKNRIKGYKDKYKSKSKLATANK